MRRPTTLASLLLVAVATTVLTLPSGARAATFCVHTQPCLADQVKPDLQAALDAAGKTFGADTILLGGDGIPQTGPFVYPKGKITVENKVAIKGVGPGRPELTAAAGRTVLALGNGSIEGVDVRLPSAAEGTGIEAGGAQVRDVRVSGPGDADGATGIDALGDVRLTGVTVSGTGARAVLARDLAVDADDLSTDRVTTGVEIGDGAVVHLAGSRIRARDFGVSTRGTAFVTRSLLETSGAAADGILASGGGLTLDHVTIAGQGGQAALNFHLVDIPGRANIAAVALAGYERGIVRDTSETGGSYPLTIRDSVWDASRDILQTAPSPGALTESNDAHVAPALTDDLRPRGSSAQLDRDSKSDLRYVDLDGIAALDRADAGAFEYRRRAPSIDAADVPAAGASGAALAFAATASDADGDRLQVVWSFGDGAVASGPRTAHTYAAAGIYAVTLRVIDEAGLAATRDFTVVVAGSPAPVATPALPATALPAPDRVVPRLTGLKLTTARGKAKLRFSLTERATVRIAVAHRAAIVRTLGAGTHSLTLRAPGRAKVTITATDAAGNRSAPRSLRTRS